MSFSDPIADMLTRVRNAQSAEHVSAAMPSSLQKVAVAKVLKEEGYITDFRVEGDGPKKELIVDLKYYKDKPVISGLKRISKPSCRIYVPAKEIPAVRGGLGVALLSTSQGVRQRSVKLVAK